MRDFSGQILEAGVWTKLQNFQPGMCTVPGRLPTTEKGVREKEWGGGETDGEKEGGKGNRGRDRKTKQQGKKKERSLKRESDEEASDLIS